MSKSSDSLARSMPAENRSILPKRPRFYELDVFRGIAIVMMIVFHVLYDLNFYRFIKIDIFNNAFWIVYRETLLFLFLSVSGVCLFLEHGKSEHQIEDIRWPSFWKRFIKLSIASLVVTLATYYFDPKSVILFGVLHFIALSSLLVLPFLNHRALSLISAFFIILMGHAGHLYEGRYYIPFMAWIGFGSASIKTFDILPLIPNFGYVLLGSAFASLALNSQKDYLFAHVPSHQKWSQILSFLGRHALPIYFIHRILSFGIVSLADRIWSY